MRVLIFATFLKRLPMIFSMFRDYQFILGHSRTIVGVERSTTGQINIVLFDPSVHRSRMLNLLNGSSDVKQYDFMRKFMKDMKHQQFQIVRFDEPTMSDLEFEICAVTYPRGKIATYWVTDLG